MKQFSFLMILIAFSGFISSCGDNNQELTNKTFTFDLPAYTIEIDAEKVCQVIPQLNCDQAGEPTPLPQEIKGNPVEFAIPVNVTETNSTAANELKKYSKSVRSAVVKAVKYESTDNTFTLPTPEINVYIGPESASKKDSSGVLQTPFMTIPSIPSKTTKSGQAEIPQGAKAGVTDILKTLNFKLFPYYVPIIKKDTLVPPKGSVKIKLTITVEITVNLYDAGKTAITGK